MLTNSLHPKVSGIVVNFKANIFLIYKMDFFLEKSANFILFNPPLVHVVCTTIVVTQFHQPHDSKPTGNWNSKMYLKSVIPRPTQLRVTSFEKYNV